MSFKSKLSILFQYILRPMCKLWSWILKDLQGIGTLMVGIAALGALIKGDDLLREILKVQQQAKQIDEAVVELKSQSAKMSVALEFLSAQMKERMADNKVANSPALNKENPTKEEIRNALSTIPNTPSAKKPTVYLPKDKIESTVNKLQKAKTPEERKQILENSFEYKGGGILLNESGGAILTEDGVPIGLETNTLDSMNKPVDEVGNWDTGK